MKKEVSFFVSLFLFWLLFEIFLRLYHIPSLDYFLKMNQIHRFHPDYFIGLQPNTSVYIRHFSGKWEGQFSINSFGMRGTKEPDPQKRKVICLGDSLVMGYGVSDHETFCALLDEKFFDHGIQFLNGGIDGLGSWGAYQRLKEILSQVSNVNTVLFFVSPNDFTMPPSLLEKGFFPDDQTEEARLLQPTKRLIDTWQFVLSDYVYTLTVAKITIKQLLLRFHLWKDTFVATLNRWKNQNLLTTIKQSFLLESQAVSCPQPTNTLFETIGKTYIPQEKRIFSQPKKCPEEIPEEILKECTEPPKVIPELPNFTQRVYLDMLELTKKNQIRFVVVILPVQIEELYCHSINRYHFLRLYALQVIRFFQKHQIEIWDLMADTPSMCQEGKWGFKDYFIPEDGHLTQLGNEWLANVLEKKLKFLIQ
ncbi:MAG: lipase [Leptospiraceae bacterium]|nr:lipase [Leptospiraceae bacterium]MDW7975438.1 lipase [Leptospiraceae bacterium]